MTRARDDRTTAGDWLAEARKAAGLSQERLAGLVGTSKSNIGNYEQGRAMVPDRLAEPLALALRLDLTETRRGLGLWVGDAGDRGRPSVLDAILADPDLLPEAKEHLSRQYALLLRVQVEPQESRDHARALDDLRRARAVEHSSPDCDA